MAEISEGANGMSYDFGVAIARGVVGNLGAVAAKVVTITGSIYALIDAGNAQDEMIRKNQLALGGYANLLNAVDFFSKKVANGESYFNVDDLIQGTRSLNRAGVDAKKNFDLINKSAQGLGMNFSELSDIIRGGDFSALAEAGLITDRMATNMDRMTFTQQQGTQKVLALLRKADGSKMFEGIVPTFKQTVMRLKGIGKDFLKSILGDAKDPEGLWYNLRKAFGAFADFFNKHGRKIKAIGMAIGRVLVFVGRVVADFLKWITNGLRNLIGDTDDFFSNWGEKMKSLTLFLEIIRVKIKTFIEDYGKLILTLWAVNSALNAVWMIGTSRASKGFLRLFKIMAAGKLPLVMRGFMARSWLGRSLRLIPRLIPLFSSLAASIWAALGPLLLPIIIIAAIIAAVVLLIKYWDDIRDRVAGVSDGVLLIVTFTSPLVGIILIIAKHWNKVKNIIHNAWITLVNFFDILTSIGKMIGQEVIKQFEFFWSMIKGIGIKIDDMFGGVFSKAWEYFELRFLDPIKKAIEKIKGWLDDAFDFGGFFTKIGHFIRGGADSSKKIAEELAKKAGRKSFAKEGVSLTVSENQDINRQFEKGRSNEQILKVVGNKNLTLADIAEKRKLYEESKKGNKKIPVSPKKIKGGKEESSVVVHNNNPITVMVKDSSDINKVIKAVNKANSMEESRDKRRGGN